MPLAIAPMSQSLTKYLLLSTFLIYSILLPITTADVLTLDDIDKANAESLLEDIKTFNSIGISIALSIAECNDQNNCAPRVSTEELEHLILTLEQRINSILTRQQSHEPELAEIVLAYVDIKEKYSNHITQLRQLEESTLDILPSLDEDTEEYTIFQDSEEELINDFDTLNSDALPELPDDTNLPEDSDNENAMLVDELESVEGQ